MTAQSEMPAAGATVNVNLRLQPTSAVTGTVLLPDGVSPAGAGISVHYQSTGFLVFCSEDSFGISDCVTIPQGIQDLASKARVSRAEDVVLTLDGRVLEGAAATSVDLEQTGTDAEGRVVYQFRKVEIYLVEVDVSRRPSLPSAKLYGVLGKLPDGKLQTLGLTRRR